VNQSEFKLNKGGLSQCEKILRFLKKKNGEWVSMVDLWRISGSMAVHSRISDLRKEGAIIEHKNERRPDGVIHSFYRLLEVLQ
jgi:catalase (peroxidase I)